MDVWVSVCGSWVSGQKSEWVNEWETKWLGAQSYLISFHLFNLYLLYTIIIWLFIAYFHQSMFYGIHKTIQYICSAISGVYTALGIRDGFLLTVSHTISDSSVYSLWPVKRISWINHAHFIRSKPVYYEKILFIYSLCKHCALCVIKCL